MKRTPVVPLAAACVALAVVGCGSSKKSSSSTPAPAPSTTSTTPAKTAGGGSTLKLSADPGGQLKFDKSSLQSKAGGVKIALKNPSTIPHNVSIQGTGVNAVGGTANGGGTTQVVATLKPGSYTFYCNVPGHRQAGMQGTLTVK